MPQTATIKSLPAAFAMMKAMQAEDVEWGEDYRPAARDALAALLEGRMDQLIDAQLERMAELGQADRRNGCYTRWLLTELGAIELHVPRTRTFSALKVVRAYARRAKDVDRLILACFLLGLSTRKVASALLPILGRPVSPATVSTVAKQLDAAVAAFHRRPLKDVYRVLVLDGVVLKRKTGAGALARPVLVALGLRPDGKKEVIDFRLASAESAAQWEHFLGDLVRRGLTGERLEMLCVDGGAGLLAALPTGLAHGLSRGAGAALLGAQDPQRPEQGAQAPPGRGQGRPAPDHERHHPAGRLVRRAPLRRPLGGPLSQGRGLPTR
jgi:transposase-like protein